MHSAGKLICILCALDDKSEDVDSMILVFKTSTLMNNLTRNKLTINYALITNCLCTNNLHLTNFLCFQVFVFQTSNRNRMDPSGPTLILWLPDRRFFLFVYFCLNWLSYNCDLEFLTFCTILRTPNKNCQLSNVDQRFLLQEIK